MEPQSNTSDHSYSRPNPETLPGKLMDLQYADDTSSLGNNNAREKMKKVKGGIPSKLARQNLFVNESKTEEFVITTL